MLAEVENSCGGILYLRAVVKGRVKRSPISVICSASRALQLIEGAIAYLMDAEVPIKRLLMLQAG